MWGLMSRREGAGSAAVRGRVVEVVRGEGEQARPYGACRHLQSASAGRSRKGEEDGATGSWGRELQGTRQQEQQQGAAACSWPSHSLVYEEVSGHRQDLASQLLAQNLVHLRPRAGVGGGEGAQNLVNLRPHTRTHKYTNRCYRAGGKGSARMGARGLAPLFNPWPHPHIHT